MNLMCVLVATSFISACSTMGKKVCTAKPSQEEICKKKATQGAWINLSVYSRCMRGMKR